MESEAAVPLSNSQSQPQTTTTITTPTPQQQQQQQVQVQVQQQQEQYQVQQQQQQQHQHLHSSSIQNPHLRPPSWVSTPMAVPQFHTQQQQQQQQQFRPLLRNSSSNNHTHTLPQGHAILRPPAGLPTTTTLTPTTIPTVSSSSHHQPWLSQSACPPLPSPSQSQSQSQSPLPPQSSFRPGPGPGPPVPVPVTASVPMHQRSLIPNQPQSHPQPMLPTSQPQLLMSSSQQQLQQHHHHIIQSHENYGQPHPRTTHPVTNQQPIAARVQASTNQRPPSTVMPHPTVVHSFPTDKTQSVHPAESCDRILSKRTIQDLLNQVDPSEKLDPDVEDVLVDIADDFIDSVMTFGCSLAKHRKSSALEAKDILLHLERTWNMTLPGFSGDEIKTYKKPVVNDIHKERLAVIKKSLTGAEMNKSSTGQTAGNVKGHLAKA